MATTKSPLGGNKVPKSPRQGSAASKVNTQKPRLSDKTPGGHGETPPMLAQKPGKRGYRTSPQGGSGNGPGKGNSLPR